MNNYAHRKTLMRAAFFTAVVATIAGCGSVTSLAKTGEGGEAGQIVVSTGGSGGELLTAAGGVAGMVVLGAGGVAIGGAAGGPSTGGSAGTQGVDAGATGGTVVTIDAGAGDAASCPRTLQTTGFGQGVAPTTVGGTSTGVVMTSGSATGGGADGSLWVNVLTANLSAQPDPTSPPASSTGSVLFDVVRDCNGSDSDEDKALQGYAVSFWLYVQGAACDTNYLPIEWRVGVVSSTGISFPWGTQMGALGTGACSGAGTRVQWDTFPAGAHGHALILQFANVSKQAFSGLIDVSDIALTFKP